MRTNDETDGERIAVCDSLITRLIISTLTPEWRNWYTHQTQNLARSNSCRFESDLRHHYLESANENRLIYRPRHFRRCAIFTRLPSSLRYPPPGRQAPHPPLVLAAFSRRHPPQLGAGCHCPRLTFGLMIYMSNLVFFVFA